MTGAEPTFLGPRASANRPPSEPALSSRPLATTAGLAVLVAVLVSGWLGREGRTP